jgi:hypothetical protein
LRGAERLSLRLDESVISLYVVLGDFRKHKLSHYDLSFDTDPFTLIP